MSITLIETAKQRRLSAILKMRPRDELDKLRTARFLAGGPKPVFSSVRSRPLQVA
jgi:hypothetical protein